MIVFLFLTKHALITRQWREIKNILFSDITQLFIMFNNLYYYCIHEQIQTFISTFTSIICLYCSACSYILLLVALIFHPWYHSATLYTTRYIQESKL